MIIDHGESCALSLTEKMKLMKAKKKKNLEKLKKHSRCYIKAKIEKRQINTEIKKLQQEWKEFISLNPDTAHEEFADRIKSVTSEQIFPKDLEAEFNGIEYDNMMGKARTMKTADLREDKGLKVPQSVSDRIEKELAMDLDSEPALVPDSEDVDDDTKALIAPIEDVGLNDRSSFIDDEGVEHDGD